jgi:hypothetical protein
VFALKQLVIRMDDVYSLSHVSRSSEQDCIRKANFMIVPSNF